MNKDEQKKALKMYLEFGYTPPELADFFDVPESEVIELLKENGVLKAEKQRRPATYTRPKKDINYNKSKLNSEQLDELFAMVNGGESQRSAARYFGLSSGHVSRILRDRR